MEIASTTAKNTYLSRLYRKFIRAHMNSISGSEENRVKVLNAAVVVAALGYFVDIYDLVLFSIVRVQSLKDLGLSGAHLMDQGLMLLNMQMAGMLIGGIIWGIMGDKKGRLAVLFGSILLYSVANLLNGFVQTIEQYALLRFVAGVGLAGELGAGITLVSEILPKEKRGLGTMVVVSVGAAGALLAGVIGEMAGWREAYFIGGGLGLMLLFLRIGVFESGIFQNVKASHIQRGNFLSLFTDKARFGKYLRCILVGLPVWFTVGILITFSPEFGRMLELQGEVSTARAVFACYAGLVIGDIISGYLSQLWKSRKKVIYLYLFLSVLMVIVYFLSRNISLQLFYVVCFGLGIAAGYWAIFVTIAAEQFGTNMRATVTTTVPNFVRGAVVPLTLGFTALKGNLGLTGSALVLGAISIGLAAVAISQLRESFSADLNFIEEL